MKRFTKLMTVLLTLAFFLCWLGCSQTTKPQPSEQNADDILRNIEQSCCPVFSGAPPSPLVDVTLEDASLTFWPYTGTNLEGTPQDPINLIFYGKADPRDIMSALMSLDGDRTALGFPPVAPFNLQWTDAIGDMQSGYGNDDWSGSAVQLALGSYEDPRFHIRLFRAGNWTIANTHFEVLIPGTADHQVLSWELAEQLVVADFIRSGLLDTDLPMLPTVQINQPNFREIPDYIYNELPVELRALISGPMGDVSSPVPIPSDGHAVILNLAESVEWQPETRVKDFVLNYDQVFPRPFCSQGEYDYVYVTGPVHLKQTVSLNNMGNYSLKFTATGTLTVITVDPITGEPIGEPFNAKVIQRHKSYLSNWRSIADGMMFQIIFPVSKPGGGWYYNRLCLNSNGNNFHINRSLCGD